MQEIGNKFSTIKERFLYVLETKGIVKDKFCNKIGMTYGNFTGKAKETPLNSNAIGNILLEIPDLNPDWLINGIGNMLRKQNNFKEKEPEILILNQSIEKKYEHQLIPVYDMNAAAGLKSLFNNSSSYHPVDYISLPKMGKVDGALFAFGDSMYPLIKSGDIIVYRQLHDLLNSIITGEMYLLSFDLEGEEYIVVKYIQESELPGHIKLVSQNQHHQPKDIPLSSVRALAQIKASVRFNIMRSGI